MDSGFWKGILLEEGAGGLRLDQTMKQTSEVWGLGSFGKLSRESREKSHGEAQKRPAI